MYASGTILGLTRGAGKGQIVRAALESIAYQSRDVLRAMEADTGLPITELRADGGASANGLLMQFQADITGARVRRPMVRETTPWARLNWRASPREFSRTLPASAASGPWSGQKTESNKSPYSKDEKGNFRP